MSVSVVAFPFDLYTDASGKPIDDGFIYVGVANTDPVVSPVAVFWDAALTIPATQPLRTTGGYVSRNGAPANFFCASDYSLRICDKTNTQIFYVASRGAGVVTDIILENGQSLIGESGSTINMKDGSVVKVGDNTGVAARLEMAANARVVGNLIPNADGAQALGSTTRGWDVFADDLFVDNGVAPTAAGVGIAPLGTTSLPWGNVVSNQMQVDDITTYRTAQPSSSSDYAGLAKLNARGTLLAACRQLGCNSAGYPDGTATLMQAASATADGPYNVTSIAESSDAQGIKFTVTFTVPLPLDVKFSITPEYRNGGLLDVGIGPVTPMVVGPLTGVSAINSVVVRLFAATGSSIVSIRHPFSLLAYGTPSATGATGIVSPIA